MRSDDNRSLVARYTAGALSPKEIDLLMERALGDQALFDELLGLEPLRNALQDPKFRAQVIADLRARTPEKKLWWRDQRWFGWRSSMVLASAAVVVILIIRSAKGPETADLQVQLGSGQQPGIPENELSESGARDPWTHSLGTAIHLGKPGQASLAFDRSGEIPVYSVNSELRIGFKVSENAAVVVTEERAQGNVVRLFPNRFQTSPTVTAGAVVLIPPAGQGPMVVDGAPGRRVVRMNVFPPEVDPLDSHLTRELLMQKVRAIVRRYEVTRP